MKYFLENKFDLVIIVLFLIFLILDIFYFADSSCFHAELFFSISFIIFFHFSYIYSKNKEAKNKSIIKSLYLFIMLLIAPITVTHLHDVDFELNVFLVVNIFILLQSMFYLFYNNKINKQIL